MTAAPARRPWDDDVDGTLTAAEHRAVCRDPAACLICMDDAAPKGEDQ